LISIAALHGLADRKIGVDLVNQLLELAGLLYRLLFGLLQLLEELSIAGFALFHLLQDLLNLVYYIIVGHEMTPFFCSLILFGRQLSVMLKGGLAFVGRNAVWS